VFMDGGRMRTREPGQGRGVHNAHWRETKNASFHRMETKSHQNDPQPELPECFRHQAYVAKLVHGLKKLKQGGRDETLASEAASAGPLPPPDDTPSMKPKTTFRTCLSSLVSSEEFGPMMAAAADSRGFYEARKKAFIADGQAYNWSIQQSWFSDFTPIADFVHVIEYVYEATQAVHADKADSWRQYVPWAAACWQGNVAGVISDLKLWQGRLGTPPKEVSDSDPRKIVSTTLNYLMNNQSRMAYPDYRRQGLPVTSSLAESLVKQISKRVKGTEMFWDDGPSGEAILQLRASVISDGHPLERWVVTRTVSPFASCCRQSTLAASV
jgi:hypothetical protein